MRSNKESRPKILNSDTTKLICIALYTICLTFALFRIYKCYHRETLPHPRGPSLAKSSTIFGIWALYSMIFHIPAYFRLYFKYSRYSCIFHNSIGFLNIPEYSSTFHPCIIYLGYWFISNEVLFTQLGRLRRGLRSTSNDG